MTEGRDRPLAAFDLGQPGEWDFLAGVDEAGRGALAGPVVAAAVFMRRDFYTSPAGRDLAAIVNDSKKLTADVRGEIRERLRSHSPEAGLCFAVGSGSVAEIADLNIIGATRLAMQRALDAALNAPGLSRDALFRDEEDDLFATAQSKGPSVRLLIDGLPLKRFPYPHRGVVRGAGKSLAIATASVLAKVTRDRLMTELDMRYPVFGLARHKGYGTSRHREALRLHGACPEHRPFFLRKLNL